MMPSRDTSRFFVIAFSFTWLLQWPGVLARWGWLPGDPNAYLALAALGIFGPLVAATTLTHRESGGSGVRRLYAGLLAWRTRPRWFFAALLVPGALLSLTLGVFHWLGREGQWLFLPAPPQIVVALVISVAEETGWRGYAQPRLNERYGLFGASCLLGTLWCLWHIPMFLAVGVSLWLLPVLLLYFWGGSLLFARIQRDTGSLLLVVLAHLGAHLNNSHAALPGDSLPLVVHAVVYAALGFWSVRRELPATRPLAARESCA